MISLFIHLNLGWFCLHPTECSRIGLCPVPALVNGSEYRDPWLLQMLKISAVFSPKQDICTTPIPLKFRVHCGRGDRKSIRTQTQSGSTLRTVTAIKNSQQLWLPALSWPKLALLPISCSRRRVYRTLPLLLSFWLPTDSVLGRGRLVFTCAPTAELTRLQQESPIQRHWLNLVDYRTEGVETNVRERFVEAGGGKMGSREIEEDGG